MNDFIFGVAWFFAATYHWVVGDDSGYVLGSVVMSTVFLQSGEIKRQIKSLKEAGPNEQ